MTIILLIFGSFHFIIASKFSHDESYLDEISEKINIDLTQIEDISIAYDCIGIYDSFAMAKIEEDKVEGFIKTLENNRNCKNEPFSELDSFDMFASFITFDYDYFLIYDISTNTYNNFSGKLIYVAYNIETNIILICCY